MREQVLAAVCGLLLWVAPAHTQHDHHVTIYTLGTVDFRASCGPAAQADLNRAVALLHHMMYQESRGAFEGIAAEHPECGMAHWGIAMTLFQPLWAARPGDGWINQSRSRSGGFWRDSTHHYIGTHDRGSAEEGGGIGFLQLPARPSSGQGPQNVVYGVVSLDEQDSNTDHQRRIRETKPVP